MTENNGSFVAASALDIHEIAVRGGHQSFKLVTLPFGFKSGVKKISVHIVGKKILRIFYK